MSIFVTIAQVPAPTNDSTVARPAFSRGLKISRMSDTTRTNIDPDELLAYEAMYFQTQSTTSPLLGVAMFYHRYGDPLHVLVAKAIEALGDVDPKSRK